MQCKFISSRSLNFLKHNTFHICFINFIPQGKGPKTFFHVGTDHSIESLKQNLNNGHQILYEDTCLSNGTQYNCGTESGYEKMPRLGLKGVPKGDYIITLPGDLTYPDIKWLSLYCRRFRLTFGDIMVNEDTVPGTHLIFQSIT